MHPKAKASGSISNILKDLSKPFPPESVKWRIGRDFKNGRGLALAYLDARDVMDRLDEVIGVGTWSSTQRIVVVNDKAYHIAAITVPSDFGTVTVEDVAADTDFEAAKGGASDSFKRAAVKLGIGRYLYGLGDTYCEIENSGQKNACIPKHELSRLTSLLSGEKNKQNLTEESVTDLTVKLRETIKNDLGEGALVKITTSLMDEYGLFNSLTPDKRIEYYKKLEEWYKDKKNNK